jgi:hypothetical protein
MTQDKKRKAKRNPSKETFDAATFMAAANQAAARELDLGPTKDGDQRLAIIADPDNGLVHINFGQTINALVLKPAEAMDMAKKLKEHAKLATRGKK